MVSRWLVDFFSRSPSKLISLPRLAASASPYIPSSSPFKILPPSASYPSLPIPHKDLQTSLLLLLYHRATSSVEVQAGKACRATCRAEAIPRLSCWMSGNG